MHNASQKTAKIISMVDQQLIVNLMRKRKDKNLLAIQRYAPHLMDLVNQKGKINCGIYVGKDGQVDLMIDGVRVYNTDPRKVAQIQLENFKKHREALYLVPATSSGHPFIDNVYKDKIVDLFGKKPEPKKLELLTSEELKEGESIGAVLSVGIGFGYHLELLTKTYDIRYLIVVERDPEIFKTSLYTADWEKLLAHYSSKGRAILLFVGDKPQDLARHMIYTLGYTLNTPLLYYTPIFIHLFGPFYEQVGKEFSKRVNELAMGWGFVQDELWSLEYTLENIKREIPLYQGKKQVPSDAVAFVIGAGPSLEYALDFIKNNKDKAVIFSCGSSIGTLYQEGIKPDFHVEIERTKATYDALVLSAGEDYLKEITVLYNNPMYPQVSELFGESLMWLKPNDTGSSLFDSQLPRIAYSNPTVVNAGLSLAVHMGFKEIYLFGADMGYKDPKKHHARGNVAFKEGTEFYKEREKEEYELEGNFGGSVYTNSMLLWAKSMIEDLIKQVRDVKVYNTSDGARIDGTLPARLWDISLRGFKKREALKLIRSDFSTKYTKEGYIKSKLEKLLEDAQKFEKFVEDTLSTKMEGRGDLMDALNTVFAWIYNTDETQTFKYMLRGGFMQMEHLCLFLSHQEGILSEKCAHLIRDYLLQALEKFRDLVEPFFVAKTQTL